MSDKTAIQAKNRWQKEKVVQFLNRPIREDDYWFWENNVIVINEQGELQSDSIYDILGELSNVRLVDVVEFEEFCSQYGVNSDPDYVWGYDYKEPVVHEVRGWGFPEGSRWSHLKSPVPYVELSFVERWEPASRKDYLEYQKKLDRPKACTATAKTGEQLTIDFDNDGSKSNSGAVKIWNERVRQQEESAKGEGHTAEHDDCHSDKQLLDAARAYINCDARYWPWHNSEFKPSLDEVHNLVKAGALIAAEIDRLQRVREKAEQDPWDELVDELSNSQVIHDYKDGHVDFRNIRSFIKGLSDKFEIKIKE